MWVKMLCLMLTLAQQCTLLWCQLMNRRSDMQMAVELLRHHVSFDKDIKVWHKCGTINHSNGTASCSIRVVSQEGQEGSLCWLKRSRHAVPGQHCCVPCVCTLTLSPARLLPDLAFRCTSSRRSFAFSEVCCQAM